MRTCADEDTLEAFLHNARIETEAIYHACAVARHRAWPSCACSSRLGRGRPALAPQPSRRNAPWLPQETRREAACPIAINVMYPSCASSCLVNSSVPMRPSSWLWRTSWEQCGLLQLAASRTPAPVKPGTCAGRKRSFSRLLSSSTARRSCRMRHCSSLRPLRAQDDSSPCLRPLTLVGRQWKNSAQVLTDSYQVGVRLCRYTVPHD